MVKCEEEWKQLVHNKVKLRTYMKFKINYEAEEYLNLYLTKY